MKKLLYGLLICIPLISIAAFACPGGKHGKHVDRMIEKLELNDEQATQFRTVMQTKHEKMRAYHKEQYQETLSQLETFLTAEQLQEFQEMRTRRMQHKKREL